jgi:hypothetical protein
MNMYKFQIKLISFLAFAFLLSSCNNDVTESFRPVPVAVGKVNQINVICDQEMWDSHVGDSLRYYYQGPFLILPQPEPLFDLRHFAPRELDHQPLLKELTNYIILANLNDDDSPTTQMVKNDLGEENVRRSKEDPSYNCPMSKDRWAKNQFVFYQFAWSYDQLAQNIIDNFPTVSKRIQEHDIPLIDRAVFHSGNNITAQNKVKDNFGAKVNIPADYMEAVDDGEVLWLRRSSDKYNSNLMITAVPYTDQKQLTPDGLKKIRDEITRKYISSTIEGSYVKVNDTDLPMFTSVKTVNGSYVLEARGIWEMVNDYMAGPFISYLIHNPNKKELLLIDGFVLAPNKAKRDYMQHLEYILKEIEY